MARPGYFVRPQVSDSRPKRSIGSRLGEAAARAAIGTGIGLVGQTGSKMLGNLFQKGGAAELAMTPEETLAQRAAKQDAEMRLAAAKTGAQRATAGLRQMQAARVPSEIEAKMAQAGKARMGTKLAPIKEERKQRESQYKMGSRDHDAFMEDLRQANRIALAGFNQEGRVDLEKIKSKLKKSGSKKGFIRMPDGTVATQKQISKKYGQLIQLHNALKGTDPATSEIVLNKAIELYNIGSAGLPLGAEYEVQPEDESFNVSEHLKLIDIAGDPIAFRNNPEAKKALSALGEKSVETLGRTSKSQPSGDSGRKRRAFVKGIREINANRNINKEQKRAQMRQLESDLDRAYGGPPIGAKY